jgi:hypothetical protein
MLVFLLKFKTGPDWEPFVVLKKELLHLNCFKKQI